MHLAQINIGTLIAPIDDPLVADFVNQLDEINTLAERSTGFVWRFQDDSGNATNVQLYDDPKQIINMSVWESPEALKAFTYLSRHVEVFKNRKQWFVPLAIPHFAMWWIPADTYPSPEEGLRRIAHLQVHGESGRAFTFRKLHSPQYFEL